MTTTISTPVTRAVDRALRLLHLTYRMVTLHRGITVADAIAHVDGYAEEGIASHNGASHNGASHNGADASSGRPSGGANGYASAVRKFEHDKKALREASIPFTVRRHGDPKGTYYRVAPRDLFLPTPATDRHGWEALQAVCPQLQQLANGLHALLPSRAARVMTVLLAYREELALHVPAWPIPQVMFTNGPLLLEWLHSALYVARCRGRKVDDHGGAPVSCDELSAATGLPRDLLQHTAVRGDRNGHDHRDRLPPVRITAVGPHAIGVYAPDMRAPWRPNGAHVDTLLQAARQLSVPLSVEAADTLRRHARPAVRSGSAPPPVTASAHE